MQASEEWKQVWEQVTNTLWEELTQAGSRLANCKASVDSQVHLIASTDNTLMEALQSQTNQHTILS